MNAPQIWTTRTLLQWCTDWLKKRGIEDSPRLDGELLLAHALKTERLQLFLDLDRPLDSDELNRFKVLIQRRAQHEPVAYILGQRDFWTLTLKVRPGVLIPRPETEHLVERVLAHLPDGEGQPALLELGIGSGAAMLALLSERPNANGTGIDIAPEAIACTTENAEACGVADRLTLLEGDLFGPLEEGTTFAAILSNPPYIRDDARPDLAPEITLWEPEMALFSGIDGMEVLRRIVTSATPFLEPGGVLALEIGADQGSLVTELLQGHDFLDIRCDKDLAGHDRVVSGVRS
ncbi:MAG: peptide chain release factor N(5)-glutamine methyltransferase [Magnetococcales bacterium]|nr:peptide chain release factor N(5)-glutamine methyltransferase [Magnetococcales bacterium]